MESGTTLSNLDAFFQKSARWSEPLTLLRELLLFGGLVEEFKWGKPCYSCNGKNTILLFVFKESCAIGFMKGALLKDPAHILARPGEHSQAMRMVKFTSSDEVKKQASILRAYISEAVANEEAGLEIPFQPVEQETVPEEFQAVLDENPSIEEAFRSLTPGRQRAYLLYFSDAKQSKTRIARIEKFLPRILERKGLQD